jgi:SPFH domain/Band 7 family protein
VIDKLRSDRGQAGSGVVAGVLVFALIVAAIWGVMALRGFRSTPPDQLALHYSGGPFEGTHFIAVVPPGTGVHFYGISEKWYEYPATQRNYIVSEKPAEGDRPEPDFIRTTSKDQQEADWQVATTFKLNTDPAVIKRFHEQLGLKFEAWNEDGWDQMLAQTLRQVLENRMNTEVGKYDIAALYSDPDTRAKVQTAVGEDLRDGVNQLAGGPFFCGPTFDPTKPTVCPPLQFLIKGRPKIPEGLVKQFDANRQSAEAVVQKDNEVQQAKKQAEAAAALQQAIANNPEYVKLKAIESGKVTFWIMPEGTNVTVPTPQR